MKTQATQPLSFLSLLKFIAMLIVVGSGYNISSQVKKLRGLRVVCQCAKYSGF